MTNKIKSLKPKVKTLLEPVIHVAVGFDVLRIYCQLSHRPNVSALKKFCENVSVRTLADQPKSPYTWEIKILQPSKEALSILGDLKRPTKINYAEINLDLITETKNQAASLQNFLLERVIVPYSKYEVFFEGNTAYFHPRSDAKNNKLPRGFVVYSDRKSKLQTEFKGMNCCHVEWRLLGRALEENGLITVEDLKGINIKRFWSGNLDLWEIPSKFELGNTLGRNKSAITDRGLRKRAATFMGKYIKNGTFILHDAYLGNKEIGRCLRKVPLSMLVKEMQK